MRSILKALPLAFLFLFLSACGGPSSTDNTKHSGAVDSAAVAEARTIAKEAYVFGVPMVEQYKTMYAYSIDKSNPQYKGPFNAILNIARVFTPDDSAFVTPNSDTPYSFIGLDLRADPVVLTVPKIQKDRYYVFQVLDLFTFNADYIGSRTTGNDGGTFLFVGPGWKGETPPGITKVMHMEISLLSVVGRTQLFNPKDLDKVKAVQAGYKVQTLSAFLGTAAPPAAPELEWPKPLDTQQARGTLDFFDRLAFLLQFAQPPHPSEVDLMARFAKIGIVPGKPFNASALSADMQAALKEGMADGQKEIDDKRASLGGKTDMLFGSRDFLKDDYVARATGTQVGIGANSRDEAIYPMYFNDADGQPLDGGAHEYTLHFAKGELPPVKSFWSLTMYTMPKQLLVRNPIDRYLINSPMLPQLKTDPDGGLTIYVQQASPGKAKESNWLPAPKGPFMITLRCYWPMPAALDGTWKMPAVVKVK